MFSPSVFRWFGLAFLLFIAALALGNIVLLSGAVFVLLIALLGVLFLPPSGMSLDRRLPRSVCWAGEVVEVCREVRVESGAGALFVHDALPEQVRLVDGSNYRVVWKWPGPKTFDLSYRLMCPKRGILHLDGTEWQTQDPLDLRRSVVESPESDLKLSVVPRLRSVDRLNDARSVAAKTPVNMRTPRVGVSTTDFVDLRTYTPGDTIRSINWKASARNLATSNELLVNRYEPEGRMTAWVFLDGADYMDVGTTLTSPIEHAIEAMGTLSWYFLSRGYTLGAYVYNSPTGLLSPDLGKKQFHQLTQLLLSFRTGPADEDLLEAVERCKSFLSRLQPEVFIITRLDVHYPRPGEDGAVRDRFETAVKRLAHLRSKANRLDKVRIINVGPQEYLPLATALERQTLSLMRWEAQPLASLIGRAGASVLEWNPMQEDFALAMLRQISSQR